MRADSGEPFFGNVVADRRPARFESLRHDERREITEVSIVGNDPIV
jgi:hypothetical protein